MKFVLFLGLGALAWADVSYTPSSKFLEVTVPARRKRLIETIDARRYLELVSEKETFYCLNGKFESFHAKAESLFSELPPEEKVNLENLFGVEGEMALKNAQRLHGAEQMAAVDDIAFSYRHLAISRRALSLLVTYYLDVGLPSVSAIYADVLLEDDFSEPLEPSLLYKLALAYSKAGHPRVRPTLRLLAARTKLKNPQGEAAIQLGGELKSVKTLSETLGVPAAKVNLKPVLMLAVDPSDQKRDLFRRIFRIMPDSSRAELAEQLPKIPVYKPEAEMAGDANAKEISPLCDLPVLWTNALSREPGAIVRALLISKSIGREAPWFLARAAKGIAATLRRLCRDSSGDSDWQVDRALEGIELLGRDGSSALPELAECASNRGHLERIAPLFRKMGPEVSGQLEQIVLTGSKPQREGAASCLALFGKSVVPSLIKGLTQADKVEHAEGVESIARTLGRLGALASDAIPALARSFDEDKKCVGLRQAACVRAIEALGEIGEKSLPYLIAASRRPLITQKVQGALAQIGEAGLPTLIQLASEGHVGIYIDMSVRAFPKTALPLIRSALLKKTQSRAYLLILLSQAAPESPEAQEGLHAILNSQLAMEHWDFALNRLTANLKDAERVLRHSNENLRLKALQIISANPKQVVALWPTIREIIHDPSIQILALGTLSHSHQDPEVRKEMVPFFKSKSSEVRSAALKIFLGEGYEHEAGDLEYVFFPILENIRIGKTDAAITALIKNLETKQYILSSMYVLGTLGSQSKAALPLISRELIENGDWAAVAAEAFIKIAGEKESAAEFAKRWAGLSRYGRNAVIYHCGNWNPDSLALLVPGFLEDIANYQRNGDSRLGIIVKALQQTAPGSIALMHTHLRERPSNLILATRYFGKEFLPELKAISQRADLGQVRGEALVEIAAIEKVAAAKILSLALQDEDAAFKRAAAAGAALLETDAKILIPELVQAAGKEKENVYYFALAKVGKEVMPWVEKALRGKDETELFVALRTCGYLGASAEQLLPLIQQATFREDREIREAATAAIRFIRSGMQRGADVAT